MGNLPVMDRNLQIALVAAALAILYGYALREQLRRDDPRFKTISRRPATFWAIMIVLWTIEAGFIGMALMYFAAWLDTR
jgi:hypothetical protein